MRTTRSLTRRKSWSTRAWRSTRRTRNLLFRLKSLTRESKTSLAGELPAGISAPGFWRRLCGCSLVRQARTWTEEFAFAVQKRLDELLQNPLLPRLRDQLRGVRWVYPRRFPYRIIYRVSGQTVLVIGVVHAARHERHRKKRV